MGLVLDILNDVRDDIAVDDDVLEEAKTRRNLAAEAGMAIEGALGWFRSGSVAHGTVNKPVTDADGGLMLDRRTYPSLGPDGDGVGPEVALDTLHALVRDEVKKTYPNATVKKSRRGLEISFNDPVDDQDPTVDLIVALTRKDAQGLWIPDRDDDSWSASHPEKHTQLFTSGSKKLRALRARVTRLAKAWNKQWAERDRALSSFNIEALVWQYIDDESVPLDEALAGWFAYARDEIEEGETEDPAEVSDPIRLLLPKATVTRRLSSAADRLQHALDNEDDPDVVKDDLAGIFYEYVEAPDQSKSGLASSIRQGSVGMTKTGIASAGTALKTTRSYGEASTDG